MRKNKIKLLSLLACLSFSGNLYAGTGNVLLWNKLGSVNEIANSEIGPGFQLTSYKISDWQQAQIIPGKFGDGLFVNHGIDEGWSNDGGNFFAANINQAGLTPEKGSIEFWFTFKYDSSTHNHAYFFLTANALANHFPNGNYHSNVTLAGGWNGWDYGSYGKRFVFQIINNSDSSHATVFTPDFSAAPGGEFGFTDGTTAHFAFVYDLNGIDGTSDTARIYINGVLAGSTAERWSISGGLEPWLYLGTTPNYSDGWDHHYNAVKGVTDNLIIRDHANTDFSDRFQEEPAGLINLNLPEQVNAEATGPAGAAVEYSVSATSKTDPSPTVVCSPLSGSQFALGNTTVNCTATNTSGNSAAGSFVVKVADTTAPVLTPPANMTVEGNAAGGANVTLPSASASDIVDAAPAVACDRSSGFFPLGDTTVRCTAKDASGNSSGGNYLVKVQDTTAPFVQPHRVSTSQYGWLPAETFTNFPARVGASPVNLETRARDVVGVSSVSIEDAPAQGGPEFWNLSGISLLEGDNALSMQATDLAGNTTKAEERVVLTLDLDRDRIRNDVDRQPKLPSYEFSDQFTTGLGRSPIDVAITPDGRRIYAANLNSGSVSVLDADTQELVATIQVGGNPYALAISPDGSHVYVANPNGRLSIIDTFSNSIVAAPSYNSFYDVAVHPDGKEIYASSSNGYVMVLDTATNQWVASTNLYGVASLALSSDGKRLFGSRWNDGAVFAIDTELMESSPAEDWAIPFMPLQCIRSPEISTPVCGTEKPSLS